MLKGFKDFISRGNVVDMAVGVVMGSAVTSVVTSIVEHFINPLIAMVFGKPDMSSLFAFTVNGATISFGAILTAGLNFLIVASAIYFFIVVPMNRLSELTSVKKAQDEVAAEVTKSAEEIQLETLQEIRDLLKSRA